jgi:phage tail sheath protein FI
VYDVFSDKQVWVPASGFAAAIFAKTDANTQPWIAPAGLNRGIINNITDLAFNPNQKQRDFLYTISINPVVSFSGEGFVIFGQKTLQTKPSAFDRVNVRRLFLSLEKATNNALKYYVFEPNTAFVRTRLKNTISPIFELAKNTDGLYDFLIVCDERNNTPEIVDRNELVVDIYIKPVKAAEFILVNFIATRTGQNFQELI